jgi:glycosyltransferase involved in cell wall biosynthesis
MAADFAAKFAIPPDKFAVLLNPIDIGAICAANCRIDQPLDWIDPWPDGSWPRLLTVGRLSAEKGIDLLIRAIPTIQLQFPRVHLLVLGTGPEEAALNRLNQELNLEETITFAGYQQNPAAFCAGATLFVLPSRYEGMPNALLEAAAAGLPLVATPCCTGICDLLRNAPGTWISSEITHHALAETVLASLDTLKTWPNPPRRIPHAFLAPFALETAIAAYTELIERAAQARP